MKLSFQPFTLFFKHPFKIAHGIRTSTPIVITKIEFENHIGYGEASMPPYLGESHESVIRFLNNAKKIIDTFDNLSDIQFIIKKIDDLAPNNTAAKASIDIALNDLIGKIKNQPCWKLLNLDKNKTPLTTYTIGIDTPENIVTKLKEAEVFKILKVKLNGDNDKLIIDTIRKVSEKPIVVDINQGWKQKEFALEMLKWLSDKNILFVEQPLPKENIDDARWLFERSPLPLFADESIQRFTDMDNLKNYFHGVNIKLMKCTGMIEAHKMILKARSLNLKILVGCMSETSCGISAAAQLSPLVDYADLDGALLIKNNLFEGMIISEGKIELLEVPGIGAIPKV